MIILMSNSDAFAVRPVGKTAAMKKEWMEASTGQRYWDWTHEQIKPYL